MIECGLAVFEKDNLIEIKKRIRGQGLVTQGVVLIKEIKNVRVQLLVDLMRGNVRVLRLTSSHFCIVMSVVFLGVPAPCGVNETMKYKNPLSKHTVRYYQLIGYLI